MIDPIKLQRKESELMKKKPLLLLLIIFVIASMILASCGGGEQQATPKPRAISVDQLHESVWQAYVNLGSFSSCSKPYRCGDFVAFDCNSMANGLNNYYNNVTVEVVMLCGGACMTHDPDNPL